MQPIAAAMPAIALMLVIGRPAEAGCGALTSLGSCAVRISGCND